MTDFWQAAAVVFIAFTAGFNFSYWLDRRRRARERKSIDPDFLCRCGHCHPDTEHFEFPAEAFYDTENWIKQRLELKQRAELKEQEEKKRKEEERLAEKEKEERKLLEKLKNKYPEES